MHAEKTSPAFDTARILDAAAKHFGTDAAATTTTHSLVLSFLRSRLQPPTPSEPSDAVRQQEDLSLVYWLSTVSILHSILPKEENPFLLEVFAVLQNGWVLFADRVRLACSASLLSKFLLPSSRLESRRRRRRKRKEEAETKDESRKKNEE